MAFSRSIKPPYQSTPMCFRSNDSGYHSNSTEPAYTPFLNLSHAHIFTTPATGSPLPQSSFCAIQRSDSVVQVLFEDEDLLKNSSCHQDDIAPLSVSSSNAADLAANGNSTDLNSKTTDSLLSETACSSTDRNKNWRQYSVVSLPGQDIGEKHIDFFRELTRFRNCQAIANQICSYLNGRDLTRVAQVCHTWRTLVENNPTLNYKRKCYLNNRKRGIHTEKENSRLNGKPQPLRISRPERPFIDLLNQVEGVQKLSPVKLESPRKPSRLPLFQEQAKRLLPCEHLQPCPRCQSPSRVTPAEKRAHCTKPQCSFDYCTQCRGDFHAPTPCKRSMFAGTRLRSPKKDLIGHKGARRNLKRL